MEAPGTAVYSQAFTPVLNGTANVTVASNSTPTNPLDLTWNAFRIYTTVISVYNNFAMDVLGAASRRSGNPLCRTVS